MSSDAENPKAVSGDNAKGQLKAIIERVENLEQDKKSFADDIKDVYAEAKGNGYDTKALRAVIKLRKQDTDALKEHKAVLDTYLMALGMEFLL